MVCRLAVLADIIGQSVVQLSDTDIFVDRDRRHLLCKYLLKMCIRDSLYTEWREVISTENIGWFL